MCMYQSHGILLFVVCAGLGFVLLSLLAVSCRVCTCVRGRCTVHTVQYYCCIHRLVRVYADSGGMEVIGSLCGSYVRRALEHS